MKPSGATPRVGFFLTILRRCAVGAEATLEVEARPMAGPDHRENPHKLIEAAVGTTGPPHDRSLP